LFTLTNYVYQHKLTRFWNGMGAKSYGYPRIIVILIRLN
jgi:hypothetical protein